MKEKIDEEDEINTNSNINNINNYNYKKKFNINTSISPINIISTNDEEDLLLNNEINLPNSNKSDYLSTSFDSTPLNMENIVKCSLIFKSSKRISC